LPIQPDLSGFAEGHIGQRFSAGLRAAQIISARFSVLACSALANMVDG
jgi:hypothetical protein